MFFNKSSSRDFGLPSRRLTTVLARIFRPAIEVIVLLLFRLKRIGVKIPEREEHAWEMVYIAAVALGVTLELAMIPVSLLEAINSANEVQRFKLQVDQFHKANLELEKQIQPRNISAEQRAQIVAELGRDKKSESVKLDFGVGDEDSERFVYAAEIESVLRESGFDVHNELGNLRLGGAVTLYFGLIMHVLDLRNAPVTAVSIVNAFRGAGVQIDAFADPTMPTNTFKIIVGHKPMSSQMPQIAR